MRTILENQTPSTSHWKENLFDFTELLFFLHWTYICDNLFNWIALFLVIWDGPNFQNKIENR